MLLALSGLIIAIYTPTSIAAEAEPEPRQSTCGEFPDQLKACDPVTCTYKHLLTRELLPRKIIGRSKQRCVYTEVLPEGKLLTCKVRNKDLKPLARHYRIFDGARDIEMIPKINSKTGEGTMEVRVDGQVAGDILERLLARGDCKVTRQKSRP